MHPVGGVHHPGFPCRNSSPETQTHIETDSGDLAHADRGVGGFRSPAAFNGILEVQLVPAQRASTGSSSGSGTPSAKKRPRLRLSRLTVEVLRFAVPEAVRNDPFVVALVSRSGLRRVRTRSCVCFALVRVATASDALYYLYPHWASRGHRKSCCRVGVGGHPECVSIWQRRIVGLEGR